MDIIMRYRDIEIDEWMMIMSSPSSNIQQFQYASIAVAASSSLTTSPPPSLLSSER